MEKEKRMRKGSFVNMKKTVWDIIRASKTIEPYTIVSTQYENLRRILSELDKEIVEELCAEWIEVTDELIDDEFEKLDLEYGGIIDASRIEKFYIDFSGWVVAQGEELFNQFKTDGHQVIIDYIQKYNIPQSEYTFESISYVFYDVPSVK